MKIKKVQAKEFKRILLKINKQHRKLQQVLAALDDEIDNLWTLGEDITGESILAEKLEV